MRVRFECHGATVGVEVDDPAWAGTVEKLFAPLRREEPTLGAPDAVIRLERAGTDGYSLVCVDAAGGAHETAFASPAGLFSAAEHAVLLRLLRGVADEAHLHASGAVVGGRALVAVGAPGAGKSSLALAWSRMGVPLLGDDVVLVHEGGEVSGFPRLVKVDRRRLGDHGLALEETVAPDPRHPEAWYDPRTGGGWARERYPVAVLARVRYHTGSDTRVRDLNEVQGLRLMLDHLLDGGLQPVPSLDRLLALGSRARVLDVDFDDARDAASRLLAAAEARTP